MKNILYCFLLLLSTVSFGQENVKNAFLEKWENSKNYLIEIVEAMPEEHFSFKPTERQKSFMEQLSHIKENIDWLTNSYFDGPKMEKSMAKTKLEIIKELKDSFSNCYNTIKNSDTKSYNEKVTFFAGDKTKLQILNLLQDHVTHHRGQIIVYLNLKGITPPRFSGW